MPHLNGFAVTEMLRDQLPETKVIGITAGASTPNNQVGETIERIVSFRGRMDYATLLGVV